MRNKDQILLESIYERILKENSDEEYLRLAQDPTANREQLQMMVYDAANVAGVKKKQMVKTLLSSLSNDELKSLDDKIKNVVEYYAKVYWDSVGEDKASYDNDRNNYLQIEYDRKFYTAGGDAYEIVTTGDFIGHKDLQIFEIHNEQQTQLAVDLSSLDGRFPSDPVTYDDKGNIIPLSQRFNSSKDDIRY